MPVPAPVLPGGDPPSRLQRALSSREELGAGRAASGLGSSPHRPLLFITHRKKTTSLKLQTRDAEGALRRLQALCPVGRSSHQVARSSRLLAPDPDWAAATPARQRYFALFFSYLSGSFFFFFLFVLKKKKKNLGCGATTGKGERDVAPRCYMREGGLASS